MFEYLLRVFFLFQIHLYHLNFLWNIQNIQLIFFYLVLKFCHVNLGINIPGKTPTDKQCKYKEATHLTCFILDTFACFSCIWRIFPSIWVSRCSKWWFVPKLLVCFFIWFSWSFNLKNYQSCMHVLTVMYYLLINEFILHRDLFLECMDHIIPFLCLISYI